MTSTSPIQITSERRGIGNVAPYSIVEVEGTNYFIGANDFYQLSSDNPVAMNSPIRSWFYDIVGSTEVKNTFGGVNQHRSEFYWTANTSDGQYMVVYDWRVGEFFVWSLPHIMNSHGMGVV